MDPITPYSEKIDLRTENGRKIYEACTKALPVVFDAAAGKHHSFLTALKNAADEHCWREICKIPVGNPAVLYDLLVKPGNISMKDLHAHCSTIWNGTTSDKVQLQIKLNMMGVCLLNSVSSSVSQRLDKDKEKWFFENRSGKDGLLIFKLLMQYSLQTTKYGSESTKDKLHKLNAINFGNNVEEMLLHRKTLIDDILAQGESFNDDLYWSFKCLETVHFPEAFVRYIEDKKSEWEDGGALTSDQLCKAAESKFKNLLEAGKWKFSSANAPSAVKESADPKFLALVAAVKELAKNTAKSSNSSSGVQSKWKFEAPPAGSSIEKHVNGKTFWWCDGADGKHHKPMFCCHKPTDCKAVSKSTSATTETPTPASGTGVAQAKKIKLDSNLSAALAALDKALLISTTSDEGLATSGNKDFA